MKGDFSRDTFDKTKHFSRVLMQQGRVQLDADWNEQTAILLHYIRTLAADLIGPFGGPAGDGYGFEITPDGTAFKIGKGRYYVDGILCEIEHDVAYDKQPDYPSPPPLEQDNNYLVYLDIWERHITALEDDYVREKALGGADTASRARIVWQVKVEVCDKTCMTSFQDMQYFEGQWRDWVARLQPSDRGCLRARVKQPNRSSDPCLTPPEAQYRGTENHLYRVEIHEAGERMKTFKWSRDNASLITAVRTFSGDTLTVDNSGGFVSGQWVELLNDELELRSQPGVLVKISQVDGETLILANAPSRPDDVADNEKWPTKARVWDHAEAGTNAIWLPLERGIEVQFLAASDTDGPSYRTGDYWLIPARAATGNIEWPEDLDGQPAVIPPHGIRHHYAPLAILPSKAGHWSNPVDLRCEFGPLRGDCGLSYSYGEEGIGGALLCAPPSPEM